jgi:hypothetical protein
MKSLKILALLAGFSLFGLEARADLSDMVFFKNRVEASKWVAEYLVAKKMPHQVINPQDPRYQAVENQMQEIWPVAIQLYPEFKNVASPQLVAVGSPGPTSQVLVHPVTQKTAHLILITTATLDRMKDLSRQAAGHFAHEAAHILLHHGRSELQQKNRKFYRISKGNEVLGFLQPADPKALADAERWMSLIRKVGPFFLNELRDLPYNGFYQTLLTYLFEKKGGTTAECQAARTAFVDWTATLTPAFTFLDQTLSRLSPDLVMKLGIRSDTIQTSLRACLTEQNPGLAVLVGAALNISPDEAKKLLDPNDIRIFDAATNMAEGLFTLTRAVRAEMRRVYVEKDIPHVRQYSFEEQADDVAYRIILEVLKRKPSLRYDILGLGKWALENYLTTPEKTICYRNVARGQIPPYGDLQRNSPAFCYRYYRQFLLIKNGFPGPW